MTNFNSLLPLFNSTNATAAKRKHLGFTAKKAAPTCTLSLTSVSALPSGGDSLNLVPFPSTTTTTSTSTTTTAMATSVPFPSSSSSSSSPPSTTPTPTPTVPIPAQTRTRVRQSSLLRRKRATACLAQPYLFPCTSSSGEDDTDPCSAQDQDQDQAAPTPPRKRARKASISCPSTSISSQSSPLPSTSVSAAASTSSRSSKSSPVHSLAVSVQRRGKGGSKKAGAELRFMCVLYRSVACVRLWREFEAASRILAVPGGWDEEEGMDVDVDGDGDCGARYGPTAQLNNGRGAATATALGAQESLFISRLRSYLVFNDVNPAWLDLTPLSREPAGRMEVDGEANPGPSASAYASASALTSGGVSTTQLPFHPHLQCQLPIMAPEQAVASLVFRFRNRDRARGKPKPEASAPAPASVDDGVDTHVKRRRSPLAGPGASWVPGES